MKKRKADAIIIGSGVGGLCCAARLAHKGMKVIVLERLGLLGGRFSTRIVKGFKIPTGAMIVPKGRRSTLQEAFDLLKTPLDVMLAKGETTYRLPHGDYEVPPKGGGLAGMLKFALKDDKKAEELFIHFRRGLAWWEPSDQISFKDWLDQYTHDENVHKLFQGFCGAFIGVNSYEVPAGEFFRFIKAIGRNITYGIAPKGNMVLMDALANSIIERGGAVEKEIDCKAILTEKGRVKGVITEKDGKEEMIVSDFVVSNTGPARTVELGGEENFEKSYLALLHEHSFTVPIVYIGISTREPLHDRPGVLNFGNTRRLVFLETPTMTCPDLAPAGRHLTVTFSVPKYSTGPLKLQDTINMAMLDLQENFPSFEKDAEIIHIGTHHKAWPVVHRWPGYPMPVRTSIENLYNVGDGCMPPGTVGIEACALTARAVAREICGRG